MMRICQGCGIPMPTDDILGTYSDGRLCTDYCNQCLNMGVFTTIYFDEEINYNILSENLKSILYKRIDIEELEED